MNHYIIMVNLDGDQKKEDTEFEYEEGETIDIDHDMYMCMEVERTESEVIYWFKQGLATYNFIW